MKTLSLIGLTSFSFGMGIAICAAIYFNAHAFDYQTGWNDGYVSGQQFESAQEQLAAHKTGLCYLASFACGKGK